MDGQMNIFDTVDSKLKIDKPIRLIELFAGIGAQAKALENLGVPFEHYRICEIDGRAVKSYNAAHGTNWKTSDVTEISGSDLGVVDTDKYCYILTYSFPCTDLSLAGKQQGMSKGSGTCSGLLWEVERLLSEMTELPQVLLMENVPQVHGKKNRADFDEWIGFLARKGYTSVWEDMNAKDFGIPQNRNRCFMVSFLGQHTYTFPAGFPLNLRMKDMLDDVVDDKFYLPDETVEKLLDKVLPGEAENNTAKEIKVRIKQATKGGCVERCAVWGCSMPIIKTARKDEAECRTVETSVLPSPNRGGHMLLCYENGDVMLYDAYNHNLVGSGGCCGTITANPQAGENCGTFYLFELCGVEHAVLLHSNGTGGDDEETPHDNALNQTQKDCKIRIRKLTPKECWRLMGFSDADFDRAAEVNSNTQLYKQAGNSIVVDVLMAIFKAML